MRDFKTWLAFGFAGLLISVCLSIGAAGALLANRAANQRAALTGTTDALTRVALLASPTVSSTPTFAATARPTATATSVASRWFDEAEQALKRGEPQRVVDLLMPEKESLVGKDRAQAYYYLGQAECQMAHFRLCAAHLYLRQSLDPSAENLMLLGSAYLQAGQYGASYEMYKQVVEWSGKDADPFRSAAQSRMDEINRLCCNKFATPTFDPRPQMTAEAFKPTATPPPFVYPQTPVRIGLADGIGKISIAPGQRQLFRFNPNDYLDHPTVQFLTFHLISADAQGPTALELDVWRQDGSDKVVLKWGDNPISTPGNHVSFRGEVFAELYNPGPETYVVDNAGFTVGILEADGKVTVYGLK